MLWYPEEPIGKGGAMFGSCTLPSRSMARAVMMTLALVVGFQAYSQITQVKSDAGRLRTAGCHVWPESRLTSTSLMPLSPEKATPAMYVVRLMGTLLPSNGVSIREVMRTGAASSQPRCCQ